MGTINSSCSLSLAPCIVDVVERTHSPSLCLVVPCFNEQEVVPRLLTALQAFETGLALPFSCLFVDDGSRDETPGLLDRACETHPGYACIHFSRNFGHQAAVSAGLMQARGDLVAVIDADLQDPPELIHSMIAKWREGFDIIYGVRTNRKEGWLLRMAYAAFYRLLKRVAHVDIPLDAGDFCLMDRRVVDHLNLMPEHNRFIRGLRGWVGFKQAGISYKREQRQAGQPKYTMRRLVNLALDGLISFSSVPLRLAAWMGALSSLLGFVLMVWALLGGLLYGKTPAGWTSLAVILLFFGGIQLMVLGIIGEYVGRIFDEVKNRPHYIVDSVKGWVTDRQAPRAQA